KKIGSVLYPVVISRPDIVKNYEILAEYMAKPYLNYMNIVNHLILFIYRT
ncbi:hypothetical protein P170DRAFT_363528, partial [Aspergillus steynii IBT 23096]